MIKAKLVAVFSAIVAVLAFSAAPAFAEFESTNGTTHGLFKTGTAVLTGGGGTLSCTSTAGEWKIRTAGKIEEQEKEGKQVPALKGPHENLTISTWTGCNVTTKSGIKATPTIGACTLQLEQGPGVVKAKGGIVSACKVETKVLFISCVLTTPAAKEAEKVNFGLEKNILENSGTNLLTTAEDTGITTTVTNGCKTGGVEGSKEGTEKAVVTAEGQKEV
jgi:hypothetical protein